MQASIRRHPIRTMVVGALATLALGMTLGGTPAHAAKSGTCAAFAATLGSTNYSGNQDRVIANKQVKGKSLFVHGEFVEFTVALDTFKVTNYTLTGAPSDKDITGGVRTVIFAEKTPNHGQILTGGLTLKLGNESITLERGNGFNMKVTAKDCPQGGIFQMEPEPGTTYTHILAPGFHYFTDDLGRTLFTNGKVVGRESPELASLISRTDTTSQWTVADGGRMGGVLGEDAIES